LFANQTEDGFSLIDSKTNLNQELACLTIFFFGRGNLVVRRQPLIPRILSVSDAAAIARKPFKPPCQNGYSENNEQLARRLSARKRFVPWGSTQTFAVTHNLPQSPAPAGVISSEKEEPLPPGIEPLILWQREECDKENCNSAAIEVDHLLVRYLRPHQRYHALSVVVFPISILTYLILIFGDIDMMYCNCICHSTLKYVFLKKIYFLLCCEISCRIIVMTNFRMHLFKCWF
jgi:hypothetical protein